MKNFYHGKKVLVTGGCGFIGSHISEKLVELGADVTILDNLSSGFFDNIKKFKDDIKFVQGSIVDQTVCDDVVKNKDIIFHLAALVSVPESVEKPQLCHDVNVTGIFNMLNAAQQNNVRRFVFSSSAAVYGTHEGVCTEQTPVGPIAPYGFTKYMGEQYCKQFAVNYGLKTVCMRYFNVFGPRQNPEGAYAAVVAKFEQCMRNNKPVVIFGDGKQTRDFIHVSHVVDANLNLGMQDQTVMNGQVFNIAMGKSITLLELVDQLKASYPKYDQEIRFEPVRAGDLKYSSADCSKYKTIQTSNLR